MKKIVSTNNTNYLSKKCCRTLVYLREFTRRQTYCTYIFLELINKIKYVLNIQIHRTGHRCVMISYSLRVMRCKYFVYNWFSRHC